MKVALVMSKHLKQYSYLFSIQTPCLQQGKLSYNKSGMSESGPRWVNNDGKMETTVTVGSVNEELFGQLSRLFQRVDVYEDISSIKNKSDYEYILIPSISIKHSYDAATSKKRIIPKNYHSEEAHLNFINTPGNKFEINTTVEYSVEIQDAHNKKILNTLLSRGYASDYSADYLCGTSSHLLSEEAKSLVGNALADSFADLLKQTEATFSPISQAKSQELALPSSLSIALRFSDDSSFAPNRILDAGEQAEILVNIKNEGNGAGYGSVLKVSSENPKVSADKEIPLGDIPAGSTKEVKVPVKAALDMADGTATFVITCSEKRGYDSKKYTLNVQASHYDKSDLVIADYKINDTNTGLGQGNGNGIPENGETVEVIPLVKNNGTGPAYNVQLSFASLSSGLEAKQKSTTIAQILPGQVAQGNLSFTIPSTFSGKGIDLTLTAADIRGAASTSKQFALATEINQPSLAYTYRIIDQKGNERSDIQNGEQAEIEIRPANKGRMEARNIAVDLSSVAVTFSKARDEILRIAPQADYAPMRFPFQVPRVTDKRSADITLKLTQKDFPGLTDTINIPIRLARPEFRITHQILDPSGNGILKQGENAELLVRVENTGQLDADNVTLSLAVTQKGVQLTGPKEMAIGRLDAGKTSEAKRFPLAIQRSADPGNLPLAFTISEKSFGTTSLPLALTIASEESEVITVKGQERSKPAAASAAYQAMPPMIAIASPINGEKTASESIALRGVAKDGKGIQSIEISVNGRSLDASGRGAKIRTSESGGNQQRDIAESIPLQQGENKITITTFNLDNLSTKETVTVFRESKKGAIYAAVIGINKYKDAALTLQYARNDAEGFASYLKTNMGLDSDHVFELYDEQATERNIRSLLGTKLRQLASSPEDTVYVFFAGHGAPEQDTSAKDEDKIKKYILAYDAEREDLQSTTIAMDYIAEVFSRIQAERIIFVVDSCYSGAGGGRTILAQRSRAVLSDDFLTRLSQGKGRIILTSCRPNEVSQESDEIKHGYFTYYLLEGLKGKADVTGDGVIDLDEISLYLKKIVPEKTKGSQNPVIKGEAEGQVVVGRVR